MSQSNWKNRERKNRRVAITLSILLHVALLFMAFGNSGGKATDSLQNMIENIFSPEAEDVESLSAENQDGA